MDTFGADLAAQDLPAVRELRYDSHPLPKCRIPSISAPLSKLDEQTIPRELHYGGPVEILFCRKTHNNRKQSSKLTTWV